MYALKPNQMSLKSVKYIVIDVYLIQYQEDLLYILLFHHHIKSVRSEHFFIYGSSYLFFLHFIDRKEKSLQTYLS